jgi:hypothetical protein
LFKPNGVATASILYLIKWCKNGHLKWAYNAFFEGKKEVISEDIGLEKGYLWEANNA